MIDNLPSTATPAGLSHASRLVNDAIVEVMNVRSHVGKIHKDRASHDALWQVVGTLNEAVNVLTRNGADCPVGDPAPSLSPRAVWELDTPAARRLLALLTEAQATAEEVDRERGNVVGEHIPTGPGESRGTDFAESVSHLAQRLHMEIVPPQGRD